MLEAVDKPTNKVEDWTAAENDKADLPNDSTRASNRFHG